MADLRTSVPPQLAQATSTTSIMLDVIVALIPALGMSVYLFGPRVLVLTLISVGACVLSEYLYRRLTHQSNTLRDCSACVTGLLLAMCLPAASPYWVPLLGGVFTFSYGKREVERGSSAEVSVWSPDTGPGSSGPPAPG